MAVAANPFSARAIRPGTIRYLFVDGESAATIVQRWIAAGRRGQIVGPHGSGKSTLLASLAPAWRDAGYGMCLFVLRDGQRSLPRHWCSEVAALQSQEAASRTSVVVIDGYEQLSWWGRLSVQLVCRWRGWGLLATAHRDMGLQTVATTSTSVALAAAVVDELDSAAGRLLGSEVIADCFTRCDGNLRETLFALYDRYEQISAKQ